LLKHEFREGSYEEADFILVNTCSFILPAKKESIETILKVCKERKEARVFVLGCLAKRYGKEVFKEMPEVDGVISPDFYPALPKVILRKGRVLKTLSGFSFLHANPDVVSTFPFAYVKLSEGCSNFCSYCAIPEIRGPLRSRPIGEIEKEVKKLVNVNFKEIILIAQDTTAFGLDRGEKELPKLLKKLSIFEGIWIRLLYLHPEKIDEELIEAISSSSNVLPYFDLPIQHASPRILKKMGRNPDVESLIKKIRLLREVFPNGFIRYTIIVGFPGESEKDLELLTAFIKETEPDYTGVFEYSEEEGTKAFKLKRRVSQSEKRIRGELISRLGEELTFQRLESLIGRNLIVLVERSENNFSVGRFYGQAPEIEGEVILAGREKEGEWKRVKIKERAGFDLVGEAF
jgi:ribosomal protein S12 methylthiotransferase